jgi:hypothetical protein
MGADRVRRYPVHDGEGAKPPSFDRVVRSLTDDELEDEILGRRGAPDYQAALLAEHERRAASPPVAS